MVNFRVPVAYASRFVYCNPKHDLSLPQVLLGKRSFGYAPACMKTRLQKAAILMGRVKSKAKARAARRNGKLGGRPRTKS